jgi:hypothetical protein
MLQFANMSDEDIATESDRDEGEMFHPLRDGEHRWMPANEAADLLVRVSAVADDVSRMIQMTALQRDPYDSRLLFKHFITEFVNFMDKFDRLQAMAMRARVEKNRTDDGVELMLSSAETSEVKAVLKQYHHEKELVMARLAVIRNKIGAHRDDLQWWDMRELWDQLSIQLIAPLYEAARVAFEAVRKLPLYEWVRTTSGDTVRFMRPLPRHLFVQEPEVPLNFRESADETQSGA